MAKTKYIFGHSVRRKNKKKGMSDNSWITESIVQFTRSPVWRTPVENFVDENCHVFTNDEEMTLKMTEIHIAFRKLMDELLTAFLQDIGVELESAIQAVHDSTQSKGVTEDPARNFLNYIFYADDFCSFHKMMVKRNIELDILSSRALRQLERDGSANSSSLNEDVVEEENALRLAIEASLEDEKVTHKLMELEDIQIQEALALSIAAEEDRLRRANGVAAQDSSSFQEEKNQIIQKLENTALEVRKENVARVIASGKITINCDAPPAVPQQSPEVSTQNSDKQPEGVLPAGVPPLPGVSRLPPHKGFGLKPLPSIQPSLRQLEISVAKNVAPPPAEKANPVKKDAEQNAPTLEEIEARAQYMREQREKILQQNKEKREKQLREFTAMGGKAETKASNLCDNEKQMTIDLVRRLREDIVREATK